MEISFKTEQSRSKMVITDIEGFYPEAFSAMMLEKNHLDSLLPLSFNTVNELDELIYDITSKKMLAKSLEIEKLKEERLKGFVLALSNLLSELDDYLLDVSEVYFSLETIYMDAGDTKFYFCLIPGYKGNLQEGLKEIFNGLLPLVDTEDEKAVRLVYGLNKIACRENFSVEDLLDELDAKPEPKEEEIIEAFEEPVIIGEDEESSIWEAKQPGLLERLKRYVKENNVFQILGDLDDGSFKEKLNEPRPEDKIKGKAPFKETRATEIKDLNDLEILDFMGGETTLLQDLEEIKGYLEGTGSQMGKKIMLENLPITIGKSKETSKEILNFPAVSRTHAKISEEDGCIYLEDLNSRNGTKINGRKIAPFSPEKLNDGDRITFADQSFYLRKFY